MVRPKRLINEIHERPFSQVPAFVPLQEPLGAAVALRCQNKRELVEAGW